MRACRVAVLVTGLVAVTGCNGGDPERADTPLDALAYATVLRGLVGPETVGDDVATSADDLTDGGTADDGDDRDVVYVWADVDPPLGLEGQTTVIDEVSDLFDVRFVDDVGAAVDHDEVGLPPRDDGVLVGIGAVSTEPPVEVRVEVYRSDDEVSAHRITLVRRDDAWVIARDETVAPEMLGDDD